MMENELARDLVEHDERASVIGASVIGSCNGLVLLATTQRLNLPKLHLINPVNLQKVNIPRSATDYQLTGRRCICVDRTFGFGYDHVNDDYKIVLLSFYENGEIGERDTFVEVYSVKKGAWRIVENNSRVEIVPDTRPGVFVNGSIHWSTGIFSLSPDKARNVIAGFNLSTESFHAVPFPFEFQKCIAWRKIYGLGGCLCTAGKVSSDMIDLWMMKEYGVAESWLNFRVCAKGLGDGVQPARHGFELLCFVGDKKVLGVGREDRWSVFDLGAGIVKEVAIGGGVAASFLNGTAFIDSLVSPEQLAVPPE